MLFLKECKKTICSLTFILYVFIIFAMYGSQFTTELDSPIRKPSPNDSDYGSIVKEVPEVLMPAAVESLISEYLAGSYTAYPFMFIKVVRLKESDTAQIAGIIEELTDITRSELDRFTEYEPGGYYGQPDENGNIMMAYKEAVLPEYHLSEDISYEHFKELMTQADAIIGKGSKYGEKYLASNFSRIPMTYEDALAEYEELMDDHIAKGYMRLYCDYLGIVLAIMPVFVCVGLWQMDKRSRMEQLIYSRKISSAKLVITRYLALVCCMVVPVALTFFHAMIGLHNLYPEKNIYFGEAVGLSVMWLLPSIMIVVSVGALISELLSPLLAIFVQGVWWYYAVMGTNGLTGSITRYTLVIRHNSLGKTGIFQEQLGDFIWNRTGYFILSLILVGLVILVYEKARKGNYDGKRNLWKNNRRKSKV